MKRLAMLVLALGVPAAAVAAPTQLKIDTAHSEVGFNIRHFFTKVHGRFTDFSGAVTYDPANLAASSVEVTIRDSSINTANERRDEDLRGDDFFMTGKFPLITFKSTKVVPGTDANHFQVIGDLTMRGVTKSVTLNTEFLGMGPIKTQRGVTTQAGFDASTTVNRKDWGLVWNRQVDQGGVASMMLDDNVDLVISVAGFEPPKVAAANTPPPATDAAKK